MSIPKFGVGTFRLQDQVATDSVPNALELDYRADLRQRGRSGPGDCRQRSGAQ